MEKKLNKKKLPKSISFIMWSILIISVVFMVVLFLLNVLPLKFFIPIVVLILIIDFINIRLLKKRKKRKYGLIMSLIMLIIYIVGIYYMVNTLSFFNDIFSKNVIEENYVVIVRNDSYNDINELKDKKMGLIKVDEEGYNKAKDKLSKVIKYEEVVEDDSYVLTDMLLSKKIDAYLIEESQSKILEENYDNYTKKTKVIYSFSVEIKEESTIKSKDVTKESFNVFISGIDTYGKINSASRSDVNIVASINPNKGTITLIHIPRDYYVSLYRKTGLKDKLAHAGIYGIDTSVKSVEKLLDIDINYYFKFNFTSLIDIVNALDGIKVYSDEAFSSGLYDENTKEVYHYVKGYNNLNGKEALSFARERHNVKGGDRGRGLHQEAIIEAIVNKLKSPKVLAKYNTILLNMKDKFITNMDEVTITNFIKMQLDKDIDWKTNKYVMDGKNGNEFTYSYPRQKLYVMLPDEDEINKVKDMINNNNNN